MDMRLFRLGEILKKFVDRESETDQRYRRSDPGHERPVMRKERAPQSQIVRSHSTVCDVRMPLYIRTNSDIEQESFQPRHETKPSSIRTIPN